MNAMRYALVLVVVECVSACLYPPSTPLRMEPTNEAAAPSDSAAIDAPTAGDAGDAASDASAPDAAMIPLFHQCTSDLFVDRSAASAERTVTFSTGANPFSYDPPCMIIAAGQTVRFLGAFIGHPLRPGISPSMLTAGSPNNPIPLQSDGTMVDVTFSAAGTYPYFCEMHHLSQMTGVIHVR